jgi:hypothetical protein
MLTVEADGVRVEERLRDGEFNCPGCAGVLRPWGWGVERMLRAHGGLPVRVRPRRSWCPSCRVSHVLLPVTALLRRADVAEVVGSALAAKVAGAGWRTIAGRLGLPGETVRGWLRSFGRRAGGIRDFFTVHLVRLAVDPVVPGPAGSAFADAAGVIAAVFAAAGARWPGVASLSPWLLACAMTHGQLISPAGPRSSINTSRPWGPPV